MEQSLEIFGNLNFGVVIVVATGVFVAGKYLITTGVRIYKDIIGVHKEVEKYLDLSKNFKVYKAQQDLIAEGVLGLIRFRIILECKEAIKVGYISDDQLETIAKIYVPYKNLGGNGLVDKYIAEVNKLPIKDD